MGDNHIKVQIAGSEEDHFDVRFGDFIKKMQALKRALLETDRLISPLCVHSALAATIDKILGPDQCENGSVTGRLEQLNVHASQNIFMVHSSIDGYKVKCVFPTQMRGIAVNAVDKQITVYGKLKYKMRDTRPYEMSVEDIDVHPAMAELPTLGSLRGIAPNATLGVRSEDFVRSVRNEWSGS